MSGSNGTGTKTPSASTSNAAKRTLAGDGAHHPDSPASIPPADLFEENDSKFIAAPDLAAIATALQKQDPDHFHHLSSLELVFLWKASGGGSRGTAKLGACSKPSGMLRYFAGCDFVIWLAADHLREMQDPDRPNVIGATRWQVEAVLFHELEHIGVEVNAKDQTETAVLRPHDAEIFGSEVERYGGWRPSVTRLAAAFTQMPLFEIGVTDG